MKKANIIQIISLILVFICLSKNYKTTNSIYTAGWLNYKKKYNQNIFVLSNPNNNYQLRFEFIGANKIYAKSISISENNLWTAHYSINQNNNIIVYSKGPNVIFEIQSNQTKTIIINYENAKTSQTKILMSKQSFSKQNFKPIEEYCVHDQQKQQTYRCLQFPRTKFYLIISKAEVIDSLIDIVSKRQENNIALENFIKKEKIIHDKKFTKDFVQEMMTKTLSAICVEKSEYEGYQFYGLCANEKLEQIQRYYSLLVIEILFSYNNQLAMWLVQNYLNLLEEKLFYSFRQNQWIPIPQNTQTFKLYLKRLYEKNQLKEEQIRKKKNLVIHIQNGLINQLLLSEVNHLSEEINYRETKKIHPTLMKMLTQSWKYESVRAKISSIYAESFTHDFYYHSKDEKLDFSVGKMSWLLKLIYQHIEIIEIYGNILQKQSLEQLLSLAKVVNGYLLDDARAKEGNFNSIIVQEKIKVYSRSLGYESLLPFVYDISPAFPLNSIFNLTTQYGLTSLPQSNPNFDQRYDFRGNINIYFNYKILFSMLYKTLQNPKNKNFREGFILMIQSCQRLIAETFELARLNNSQTFYSSWTAEKKGKKSEKYLALINSAFMKDLTELKKPVQSKKKSQKLSKDQ